METEFFYISRNNYRKLICSVQLSGKWLNYIAVYLMLFSYNAVLIKYCTVHYYPLYFFLMLMYLLPLFPVFHGFFVLKKFLYSSRASIILADKKMVFKENSIFFVYPDGTYSTLPLEDILFVKKYRKYYLFYFDKTFFLPLDVQLLKFPPENLAAFFGEKFISS